MNERVDVLVIGGINTDYVGIGKSLPGSGQTRNGERFFETPGGKGANQAVAAARLGARVALIGAVGADQRGRHLVDHLRRAGVDTRHVSELAGHSTGAALIHVDGEGRKQILAIPGANTALDQEHVRRACDTIGAAGVVLAQLEVPLACVTLALEWGRQQRAITVLDPAPPQPLQEAVLKYVDVIRPNTHEAEVLTGVVVRDREAARTAARRLLDRGVGAAIVDAGKDGNLLLGRGVEHLWPLHDVVAVDATGAGDAFAGTLAMYLARGASLVEAGTFASGAAALATTRLGAQEPPISQEDLLAFLRDRAIRASAQVE